MRVIVWGSEDTRLCLDMSEGQCGRSVCGGPQFRGPKSGALTLFTARGDRVHVPQCLHEGGVNLELPTGR